MLEEARAALDRSPAEALARLDAYAAAFPSGALAPERELMAIEALGRLGRSADARKRGETFLAAHPGSMVAERVRATLATLPAR